MRVCITDIIKYVSIRKGAKSPGDKKKLFFLYGKIGTFLWECKFPQKPRRTAGEMFYFFNCKNIVETIIASLFFNLLWKLFKHTL